MSKRKSKLIYKLLKNYQANPTSRLRSCPHLLNLATKLKKTQEMKEKLDLAYILPTHKLKEEGRPYHFPSYTLSSNNQANKRKSALLGLKKTRGG